MYRKHSIVWISELSFYTFTDNLIFWVSWRIRWTFQFFLECYIKDRASPIALSLTICKVLLQSNNLAPTFALIFSIVLLRRYNMDDILLKGKLKRSEIGIKILALYGSEVTYQMDHQSGDKGGSVLWHGLIQQVCLCPYI